MCHLSKLTQLLTLALMALLVACSPTAIPTPSPTPVPPTPTREYNQLPIPMSVISGKFDVGGHDLYLECYGEGSPTVVLENGLGMNLAAAWYRIIPNIAVATRVCGYERANMGMSGEAPGPRTSQQMVEDLHALLKVAKIEGPYVLVGHSFGGENVRLYANQYPAEVAAVALVDSSHPDQDARSLAVLPAPSLEDSSELIALRTDLSKPATGLPEELDWETSQDQVRVVKSLGDVPLIVLAHGPNSEQTRAMWSGLPDDVMNKLEQVWQDLQKELASLSSNSTLVVATKAGHFIQADEPQVVIDAILDLVDKTRQK